MSPLTKKRTALLSIFSLLYASSREKTTVLTVDRKLLEAGIVNIPFAVRQADAAEMRATL